MAAQYAVSRHRKVNERTKVIKSLSYFTYFVKTMHQMINSFLFGVKNRKPGLAIAFDKGQEYSPPARSGARDVPTVLDSNRSTQGSWQFIAVLVEETL
jgi:hypothetical protein